MKIATIGSSTLHLCDCMELMKQSPDGYFDLAIVDPPYGIGESGDKIIDTHVGSASSLIACHRAGFDFVGFEIDSEYYAAASDRLTAEMSQIHFDFTNTTSIGYTEALQETLFSGGAE